MNVHTSRAGITGTLLFGGTLGAANAANAAFSLTSAYVDLQAGAISAASSDVSVTATGISAVGANSSLSLSAFTAGGFTLAAGGSYLIGVNGPLTFANGGTETGTIVNFAVVPAPAAASLLGVIGLVGSRRRR